MIDALRQFWWWLWTGRTSLEAQRRALEEDCRRFGGQVTWTDTH